MKELFEDIKVAENDLVLAESLAEELAEIHKSTYKTDCCVDFIEGFGRPLEFNFKTKSYDIFIKNISEHFSAVEFPVMAPFRQSEPLSRKDKLFNTSCYEIRRRAQKEGAELFKPELILPRKKLDQILSAISVLSGSYYSEKMFRFEQEEFDARFITATAYHYRKLGHPFKKISKILLWEPQLRH